MNGSKWITKARRLAIYSRDGFCCIYCESRANLTLDHLKPRSKGGNHKSSNLITCCLSCNSSRGDKPWWEFASGDAQKRVTVYRRRGLKVRTKLAKKALLTMSWGEIMYFFNDAKHCF